MAKYRKKPVVIEAMQWLGDNRVELAQWINPNLNIEDNMLIPGFGFYIETLEGTMRADKNDWIIKGVKGEFYPCKPDIFEATYEEVI